MNILVLGGGDSPERDVSLRSAAAVTKAASELGHTVAQLDPRDDASLLETALAKADIVLPILHGAGGEDGQIQRLIEAAGKPYLGAGVAASELCFDKVLYKKMLLEHHILTPAYEVVDKNGFKKSPLVQRPFVLKPFDGGSSLNTFIVRDPAHLPAGVEDALRSHPQMLLEELIEGTEVTAGVLDQTALPVVEIVPPQGQEFDYENKYNGATQELCPPQHVSLADQLAARQLAETVHLLTGCHHLSRTDIIITPEHHLYVLETNTIPGLTDQSLFPKAAAAAGIAWPGLVKQFIDLATGQPSNRS